MYEGACMRLHRGRRHQPACMRLHRGRQHQPACMRLHRIGAVGGSTAFPWFREFCGRLLTVNCERLA